MLTKDLFSQGVKHKMKVPLVRQLSTGDLTQLQSAILKGQLY